MPTMSQLYGHYARTVALGYTLLTILTEEDVVHIASIGRSIK